VISQKRDSEKFQDPIHRGMKVWKNFERMPFFVSVGMYVRVSESERQRERERVRSQREWRKKKRKKFKASKYQLVKRITRQGVVFLLDSE
jgi:hypothetical protein